MSDLGKNFDSILKKTQSSAKYRAMQLPEPFLLDILKHEAPHSRNKAELEKRFREKLHNVVAPYLEDIDYHAEIEKLDTLVKTHLHPTDWQDYCLSIMIKHNSTRERLPHIHAFMKILRPFIFRSQTILDLACALDPLLLPWFDLSPETRYLAYDIHQPRIDYLNTFFQAFHPNGKAIQQDILAEPPTQKAELALFLKEAHRFEKRAPGCNRLFFASIPAKTLIVSLPAEDLAGKHSLEAYHTRIVEEAIAGKNWPVETSFAGNEILFIIHKEAA